MITKFHCYTKPELEEIETECNFTNDEREVVELLQDRKSYEQIAQKLCCSPATVGRMIRRINDKIERRNNMGVPIWEKVNLSIEEAAEYSNIGINKLYEMVKSPTCTYTLYVGKRTLIKRKAFEKYLEKVNEV